MSDRNFMRSSGS